MDKNYIISNITNLCPTFKNQFVKLLGLLKVPTKCEAQDTAGLSLSRGYVTYWRYPGALEGSFLTGKAKLNEEEDFSSNTEG